MSDHEKTKEELLEEIRINRAALKRTQEIAKIGSWELDLQSNKLYWSKQNYRLFDIDEKTPPTLLFDIYRSRFNNPSELERVDDLVKRLVERGENYEIEHSIKTREGKNKYIKGIAKALKDSSGTVIGIQGTAQDITQQKEQENRIKQQKSVLIELASMQDTGFVETLDKITELAAKTLNEARVSIWEVREDISGLYCKSLYKMKEGIHENGMIVNSKDHPNYFKALRKGMSLVIADAHTDPRTEELSEDYLIPLGISSMLDVFIKGQGDNKDVGVVCIEHVGPKRNWTEEDEQFAMSIANIASLAIDRNERKLTEEKLQKSQALLKSSLESFEDIIVLSIDTNYQYLYFNDSHFHIMQSSYNQEVAIGMNILDYITKDDDKKRIKANYDRALAGESHSTIEFYADAEGSYYESFYNPIRNKKNEIMGVSMMSRDITKRKQAEEMLTKLSTNFAHLKGKSFFDAVCEDAAKVTGLDCVFVGKLNPERNSVATLGGYLNGQTMNSLTYDLEHTPCKNLLNESVCIYPNNLQQIFPSDHILKELEAQSYLGVALFSKDKQTIGIMVGLHASELLDQNIKKSLFSIYNERVSAELQRIDYEDELILAKEKAEQSEERFLVASQAAQLGIFDWDIEQDQLIWDDRMYELFGRDKESTTESTLELWSNTLHPDDKEKAIKELNDAIKGVKEFDSTFRIVHLDGKIVYVKGNGSIIRDSKGKAIRMIGVNRDITAPTVKENELIRYNDLLEESQKIGQLGGWELDLETNHLYWTQETYRIHDTSPEEFDPTVDAGVGYFLPESRQIISEALEKAMTDGTGYDLYLETYTTKGRLIDVRTTCHVTMKNGKPSKLFGIFQDITEQKFREKKLVESLKEVSDYKYAINESSIVSITDVKGTITYCNDNFCQISKLSRYELVGQNHRIINSGFHSREFWIDMWQTIVIGKIWRADIKNKANDGSFYWVDTFIIPFKDENEKITHFMSIRYDITEKKEREAQTILKNQALKKANHELDNFVYRVSHDLRAPITSSLGIIELCLMEDPPESIKELLSKQLISMNKLDRFIQDILNYSRNTRLGINKAPIDFKDFIEGIIEEHKSQSPSVAVRIKIEGESIFISDEMRLSIIFNNLISNAFKFSAAYKEDSFIEINAKILEDSVTIYVTDNGVGIKESHLDSIFDMFYRATDTNYGTGLGLYIVKEAIQKIEGDIQVESTYGEGTTFTLKLPNFDLNE